MSQMLGHQLDVAVAGRFAEPEHLLGGRAHFGHVVRTRQRDALAVERIGDAGAYCRYAGRWCRRLLAERRMVPVFGPSRALVPGDRSAGHEWPRHRGTGASMAQSEADQGSSTTSTGRRRRRTGPSRHSQARPRPAPRRPHRRCTPRQRSRKARLAAAASPARGSWACVEPGTKDVGLGDDRPWPAREAAHRPHAYSSTASS